MKVPVLIPRIFDHPHTYLSEKYGKLKDLKEVPNKTNANIKNALFVGSTAELQKMLHKKTIETNSERKSENEQFEGKDITPK